MMRADLKRLQREIDSGRTAATFVFTANRSRACSAERRGRAKPPAKSV